jgi:hypothetical protein
MLLVLGLLSQAQAHNTCTLIRAGQPAAVITAAADPAYTTPEQQVTQVAKIRLTSKHIKAVNRRRRIYVNNDVGYGAPMGSTISPITPEQWIEARFSAFSQPGSQVDCVGWCLDEGNIVAYPSKILTQLQYPTLLRWQGEGVDIVKLIVKESHRRNIEAFWEYRINGADRETDLGTPARIPLKDQHPEWLVDGGWWGPGLWNYAVPEVRARGVTILRELAENYDLDGINLDCGRHPPFLPIGQQWEQREAMTDFVRQVRLMLQEVAKRRGRPFLLSVRVADTVPGCHFDGLDIETWVKQNLVDMIIIGTRSIQVDLAGFREITRGSHVKLYPCIDQHHSPQFYHQVGIEYLRGIAANWWHQGADGVATFNFWNELPEMAPRLVGDAYGDDDYRRSLWPMSGGESVHARAYRELGDPAGLARLDKVFVVARRYDDRNGWDGRWDYYINANPQVHLPALLSADALGIDTSNHALHGRANPDWIEIDVADDVGAQPGRVERLQLRLLFTGNPSSTSIRVKFNGVELRDPTVEQGWWTFTLTPQQMAVGRNLLTIRDTRPPATANLIILEKVEVHVKYQGKQNGK